ncbi:MAG TPA: hypothetical protein VN889_04965, partial [Solirubrobacteraceae bacterium]|nr:hypothetical protein [Solirubrobacteraceae bacterium]
GTEPDDIAARLRALGEDRALRERLGAAARAAALEYSWAKMVERHDSLYASVVGAPAYSAAGAAPSA